MVRPAWSTITLTVFAAAAFSLATATAQQPTAPFRIEEASIAGIHAAMKAGRLTCRGLVEQYLARIEAYDKAGPALNAIVVLNPEALAQADAMDRAARQGTPQGPLVLRSRDRQGQLRDNGTTERGRIPLAARVRLGARRVSGQADQGSRRDRHREVEHGGVRVLAVRDRRLDPSRLHQEPLCARSGHGRLERRHGRGSRRQLRRHRTRKRHGQLHPRPLVPPGARRHSIDDGVDEPGGGRPAESPRRHRRPHDAHATRRCGRPAGHRRARPR